MTDPTAPDARSEYTAGLRALADMLDANPELPLPYNGLRPEIRLSIFTHTREEAAAYARLLPGKVDKEVTDSSYFGLDLKGALHGLHVLVHVPREKVCTRVVKGTRQVTRTEPIVTGHREVTETVEDVEWECGPLLAEASS